LQNTQDLKQTQDLLKVKSHCFSYRISHLTEHLKKNRKDYGTQRSLQLLVGKRRSLLDYLKKKEINRYRAIVKELGLRR